MDMTGQTLTQPKRTPQSSKVRSLCIIPLLIIFLYQLEKKVLRKQSKRGQKKASRMNYLVMSDSSALNAQTCCYPIKLYGVQVCRKLKPFLAHTLDSLFYTFQFLAFY